VIILGGLALAASFAMLGWSDYRMIAANQTTRIDWSFRAGTARPRWTAALGSLAFALWYLAAYILFIHSTVPIWVLPAIALPYFALLVVPIWNHNGKIKYGSDW